MSRGTAFTNPKPRRGDSKPRRVVAAGLLACRRAGLLHPPRKAATEDGQPGGKNLPTIRRLTFVVPAKAPAVLSGRQRCAPFTAGRMPAATSVFGIYRPAGACAGYPPTHGSRRGLFSAAAPQLGAKESPADCLRIFAAGQPWGHGVCRSSWCLLFRSFWLSGARVPQLPSSIADLRRMDVARHRSRGATHAYSGEQTPLLLSAKAILTRPHGASCAFYQHPKSG